MSSEAGARSRRRLVIAVVVVLVVVFVVLPIVLTNTLIAECAGRPAARVCERVGLDSNA